MSMNIAQKNFPPTEERISKVLLNEEGSKAGKEIVLDLDDLLTATIGNVYELNFTITRKSYLAQDILVILRRISDDNIEEDFILKKLQINSGNDQEQITIDFYPNMFNRNNKDSFNQVVIKADELNPYLEIDIEQITVYQLRNYLDFTAKYLFAEDTETEATNPNFKIILNDDIFNIGNDKYLEIVEDLDIDITFLGYVEGKGNVVYKYEEEE